MKKLFFILSLILIASACATRKQSEKHVSDSQLSTQTVETAKHESSQSSGVTDTEKSEDVDIDIHITRYDTDKPVDPATGRPPVKEDEDRTVKKRSNEKTNSRQENQTELTETGKQTNDNQNNLVADETTDTSAEAAGGRNFVWVWITGTGIFCVCTLIYFLLKK